jgi:hypothetical protein
MVFRAEGEFDRVAADGCGDGASDERAGDFTLAIVRSEDRQECLSYWGRDVVLASFPVSFVPGPLRSSLGAAFADES